MKTVSATSITSEPLTSTCPVAGLLIGPLPASAKPGITVYAFTDVERMPLALAALAEAANLNRHEFPWVSRWRSNGLNRSHWCPRAATLDPGNPPNVRDIP